MQNQKSFIDFYGRYPELLPCGMKNCDGGGYAEAFDALYADLSPAGCLDTFLKNFSQPGTECKIMVIVDEYDNFTNDILSRDKELFEKLANKQGHTGDISVMERSNNISGIRMVPGNLISNLPHSDVSHGNEKMLVTIVFIILCFNTKNLSLKMEYPVRQNKIPVMEEVTGSNFCDVISQNATGSGWSEHIQLRSADCSGQILLL